MGIGPLLLRVFSSFRMIAARGFGLTARNTTTKQARRNSLQLYAKRHARSRVNGARVAPVLPIPSRIPGGINIIGPCLGWPLIA